MASTLAITLTSLVESEYPLVSILTARESLGLVLAIITTLGSSGSSCMAQILLIGRSDAGTFQEIWTLLPRTV